MTKIYPHLFRNYRKSNKLKVLHVKGKLQCKKKDKKKLFLEQQKTADTHARAPHVDGGLFG